MLAAAGPHGCSREQVLAILWPDSEPDKARHALSQTLYSLRQDLGGDFVIATVKDLRIDYERIAPDLEELRGAIASRDGARASALYTGPFLDGFYLAGAPEFERWAEDERRTLERQVARCIDEASREAAAAGRHDDALALAERLTGIDPLEGSYVARLVSELLALGRRHEATARGEAYIARVASELDTPPDERVLRLLGSAGGDPSPRSAGPPPSTDASAAGDAALAAASRMPAAPARFRRARVAMAAGALLLTAVAVAVIASYRRAAAPPVVAVGIVRDLVTPDSAQLGGVSSEMLATSLGRLTNLAVIANSRMLELMPRGADTVAAARADAARRAGATELLEGELMMTTDRLLHLSIRRVDLQRGLVRAAYQATGSDRLLLIDSVTSLIAADLDLRVPAQSLGDVATRSPLAYRMYEEGLRAFFQFDVYAANRLFHAAVREDSGFAMAVYYAWRSEAAIGGPQAGALARRAVALAPGIPDRDRLLIMTHVGLAHGDLRAIATADSLAARLDRDPEALILAAEAAPDLPRAVALLDRAIALDSASASAPLSVCRSCDALGALARRFAMADSTEAVERTYRRWMRIRPGDSRPWEELGEYLLGIGRKEASDAALRRADALGAAGIDSDERRLTRALRSDDLQAASAICRRGLATSNAAQWLRFRRPCVTALRMQGRHREALALVRGGPASGVAPRSLPRDTLLEAILDLEMGRPRAAAETFLKVAAAASADTMLPPGIAAQAVAWNLGLAATALVDGFDTLGARALVDTVHSAAMRSLGSREAGLHGFLRGLLLSRAGDHEGAVREYRSAFTSPSRGFTRINAELAGSLIAVGRPREAVPVLRAALHGEFSDSELFVTRTELHRLLGRAYLAAGEPDSAAAHDRIVAGASVTAELPRAARRARE